MLRLLDADEGRVLLSRERAHPVHRQDRLVPAVAAAVNPLLVRRLVGPLVLGAGFLMAATVAFIALDQVWFEAAGH